MLKETLAASIALFGMNAAASAQTIAGRSCALPSLVDTATLEQVPGTDLMTVPVTVNGTAEHFLLDIGTGQTEVAQTVVAKLGLPENNKLGEAIGGAYRSYGSGLGQAARSYGLDRGTDLGALTGGGLGDVSVYNVRDDTGRDALRTRVRIGSFAVGRATADHLIFMVANDAEMGTASEPYGGLLTGDFFKQYDVELDFAGRQVNWLTPATCTDPDQAVFWRHSAVAVIPTTIAEGKFQTQVMVEGHPVNAVIDTSSSRTVMRRDIAELVFGLKAGADMSPDGDLKDGKGQSVYAHTFKQISFAGGVTASNVPALILTNTLTHEINGGPVLGSWARSADARIPDLTLGMDVLKQLHLYIVPGQGKVYVTSAG